MVRNVVLSLCGHSGLSEVSSWMSEKKVCSASIPEDPLKGPPSKTYNLHHALVSPLKMKKLVNKEGIQTYQSRLQFTLHSQKQKIYRDCSPRAFAGLKMAILGCFWWILNLSRGPTSSYIDPLSEQICTDLRGVGNPWKMGGNPPMGGSKQCLDIIVW